jgi:hypothetical protein
VSLRSQRQARIAICAQRSGPGRRAVPRTATERDQHQRDREGSGQACHPRGVHPADERRQPRSENSEERDEACAGKHHDRQRHGDQPAAQARSGRGEPTRRQRQPCGTKQHRETGVPGDVEVRRHRRSERERRMLDHRPREGKRVAAHDHERPDIRPRHHQQPNIAPVAVVGDKQEDREHVETRDHGEHRGHEAHGRAELTATRHDQRPGRENNGERSQSERTTRNVSCGSHTLHRHDTVIPRGHVGERTRRRGRPTFWRCFRSLGTQQRACSSCAVRRCWRC